MNWDAVGAIAELLAAVGVIISLIFVGFQVRKSNAEARAATMQATTDTEVAMVATFARNAEVWAKVVTGQRLEGEIETRKGILLFALLMIDYENRFHQHRAGNLDERSWNGRLNLMGELTELPIFETWRQSQGGQSRGADFLDVVDGISKRENEKQARPEGTPSQD